MSGASARGRIKAPGLMGGPAPADVAVWGQLEPGNCRGRWDPNHCRVRAYTLNQVIQNHRQTRFGGWSAR